MAYYNKLRDQLRNETPIPEDLSWESMQAGIYDKMGQKKKKRRLFIWWLLPVLTCGIIGAALYFGKAKNTSIPLENDKENKILATSTPTPSLSISKENLADHPNTNTSEIQPQSSPIKTMANTSQVITSKVSKESKNTVLLETELSKPSTNQSTQTTNSNQTSLFKNEQTNISPASIDIVSIENSQTNQESSDLLNSNDPIPYVIIEPLALLFDEELNSLYFPMLTLPEVSPTLPAQNKKSEYFGSMGVMVNTGVSFWNIGKPATLQLNSELHKALISEKELPGFSMAIRHDIAINKSFFVTSMIDYQRLYSIFSYDGIKTAPKQMDDIIISIHDNLLSGEKTYVRGTASVNETVTRKLQNRNEMVRSSFSILPGLQHNVRNWTFKVNAGPTIGLFTSGKGKTMWNDEVVTYDGDLPQYNNNVKIGFTSSALVKYYISQRWFLHSTVLYQKYLTNHSADPTQIVKPSLWNISAGVGYSF